MAIILSLLLQRTALYMACEEGHTQVVELLLEHGADMNLTNNLKVRDIVTFIYNFFIIM